MKSDWCCELCGLTVSSQAFMNRHMRQVHSSPNATVQQHVLNFPESCPACDLRLRNPQDLLVHAKRIHHFSGTVKRKRFKSYIEFLRWKRAVEEEQIASWVKRTENTQRNLFFEYLRCYKSQNTKLHGQKSILQPENSQGRKGKSSDTSEKSCTSFINVLRNMDTGTTTIAYCLEHFGHDKDPQKLRLSWSVKKEIADMLKQKLSSGQIVQIMKTKTNYDRMKREYWITPQDVWTVARMLATNPERFVRNEPTPVKGPCYPVKCRSIQAGFVESSIPPIPVEFFFKEEQSSPEISFAEGFTGNEEPGNIESSHPELLFESAPGSAEIKEEPCSTASLSAESSSRSEPSPVGPPCDDGVRVFTLSVAPDGKGFALVDQY